MGQDSQDETVKVRAYESDRQRINSLKRGNESQQDVIRKVLDACRLGEDQDQLGPETVDADMPSDLREQLDRIESAASTAEERTGQIQGTLEGMGARR